MREEYLMKERRISLIMNSIANDAVFPCLICPVTRWKIDALTYVSVWDINERIEKNFSLDSFWLVFCVDSNRLCTRTQIGRPRTTIWSAIWIRLHHVFSSISLEISNVMRSILDIRKKKRKNIDFGSLNINYSHLMRGKTTSRLMTVLIIHYEIHMSSDVSWLRWR